MVDLYVALIINKRRTIDQVPAQFKDAVLADLNALGLDGYGNPLPD
ncbi:CD1375 family protein [Caldifermentibacillus hisashii]